MKYLILFLTVVLSTITLGLGCQGSKNPDEIMSQLVPTSSVLPTSSSVQSSGWGPETPNFNLEVILPDIHGGNGYGLVKFRQPNDGQFVVNLDTRVHDLAPNTSYRLQRAVDTTLDKVCTSEAWLSLGKGLTPQAIVTDASGTAKEDLWRILPPTPGATFDIHFQVIEDSTGTVVLQSDCYQFTISQ